MGRRPGNERPVHEVGRTVRVDEALRCPGGGLRQRRVAPVDFRAAGSLPGRVAAIGDLETPSCRWRERWGLTRGDLGGIVSRFKKVGRVVTSGSRTRSDGNPVSGGAAGCVGLTTCATRRRPRREPVVSGVGSPDFCHAITALSRGDAVSGPSRMLCQVFFRSFTPPRVACRCPTAG